MDTARTTLAGQRRAPSAPGALVLVWTLSSLLAGCSTAPAGDEGSETLVGEPIRPSAPASDRRDPEGERGRAHREGRPREGALWYRIATEGPILEVRLRLLRPAERSSFFLPAPERRETATLRAITVEGASGPDGPVPHRQYPDERRIDVESAGLDWVELVYRVDLRAFSEGGTRPRPNFSHGTVLGYLPDLLIVPSRRIASSLRAIPVEIHAPPDWTVRATWQKSDRHPSETAGPERVHGFIARDVRTLRDAFFVAGPNLTAREPGDGSIAVAFEPAMEIPESQFVHLVEEVVETYRERFGSTGRVLAYARAAPDSESTALQGTAKRNGFVVRLPERRPLRDEVSLLVAHEALHLWNGHHAIPDPEAQDDLQWFEEGVTHYLAVKTLFEIGRIDRKGVRRQFSESVFFYRRNPAAGRGRATRLDLARLPYDRGVLLGLALDAALHRCTNGSASVARWLRRLLGDEPSHYGAARLASTFTRTAGADCSAADRTWRDRVQGDDLDPSTLLDRVGLHYIEAETVEASKVLPIDGDDSLFGALFRRNRAPAGVSPSSALFHDSTAPLYP